MLKRACILFLLAQAPALVFGEAVKSIYNPQTGRPDYITRIDSTIPVSASSITATSTITVTHATAPNTSLKLFIQPLPLSGGIGPQVNSDVIWARTSIDGGQVGNFMLVASTDEAKLAAGGAPDSTRSYGALYLNPLYATLYFGDANNPFGPSSGGFQFSVSGMSFPDGTTQASAAPAIYPSTGIPNFPPGLTVGGTLNAQAISATGITATGQIAQTNPLLGDLDNGSFFIDNNSGDVVGYRSGIRYGFAGSEFGQEYFQMTGASAGHEFDKYVVEVTSDGTRGAMLSIDPKINRTTIATGLSIGGNLAITAGTYTDGQMLFGVTATGGVNFSTMSGTANQITFTASTFNVTASLPQNINTTATPQFIAEGLGTPGGTSQYIKTAAGTTTKCVANFTPGTKKTSGGQAGDFETDTDDVYYTITTGVSRKTFILSDGINLTSGRIPFATTNGRLTDNSFFTFTNNSRLGISGGSGGGSIALNAGGRPNPVAAGDIWVDTTTARLRIGLQSSSETVAMIESSETWTAAQTFSSATVVNLSITSSTYFSMGPAIDVSTTSNNWQFPQGPIVSATATVASTITGFAAPSGNLNFELINVGTNTITISQESASSTAANRIWTNTGANTTIAAGLQFGASAEFIYDKRISRWRQTR